MTNISKLTEYHCRHFPISWEQEGGLLEQVAGKAYQAGARGISSLGTLREGVRGALHWIIGKAVVLASIDRDVTRAIKHFLSFVFLPFYLFLYCFPNSSLPERVIYTILALAFFPVALFLWAKSRLEMEPSPGMKQHLQSARERLLGISGCKRVQITTPDDCVLDGVLYIPEDADRDKILFEMNGNADFYEYSVEKQMARARNLKVPLLVFNPRGVGESTGSPSSRGFALDVYSAYHFAIEDLGIRPRNIISNGRSLGAARVCLGAALVQEEYPNEPLSVGNNLSFKDLDCEIRHLLGNGRLAALACKIVRWSGWVMDSKRALETLQGRKLIVYAPEGEDTIIPHAASMKQGIDDDQDNDHSQIEMMELHSSNGEEAHNRDFNFQERMTLESRLATYFGSASTHFGTKYAQNLVSGVFRDLEASRAS
jgi:hypothetical protein